MMSTYEGLLSNCIAPHTWMLFPTGWSEAGDWPDLAATGAPSPLLVQFLLDDALFTVDGMRDANSRIARTYAQTGEPECLQGVSSIPDRTASTFPCRRRRSSGFSATSSRAHEDELERGLCTFGDLVADPRSKGAFRPDRQL